MLPSEKEAAAVCTEQMIGRKWPPAGLQAGPRPWQHHPQTPRWAQRQAREEGTMAALEATEQIKIGQTVHTMMAAST